MVAAPIAELSADRSDGVPFSLDLLLGLLVLRFLAPKEYADLTRDPFRNAGIIFDRAVARRGLLGEEPANNGMDRHVARFLLDTRVL